MESINMARIIFFGLCLVSGIVFLIFILRQEDKGLDYNKIIRELNKNKEKDLKKLNIKNKEINNIEEKILKCKKELGMRLFDEK
ncbi:MAG: hypothetical protein Q4G04_06675 [bacterium]|nr:hypothetical protein [bacterium]